MKNNCETSNTDNFELKNILAIHDISCLGKCSLTVALPIISACGHTVTVLPTAILSTHTGGFTGYTFNDLTSDLLPIVNHWKSLDVKFDCIYIGYLGSIHQVDIVRQIIAMFKTEKTLVVIDPVMGDHGKLYVGFDDAFARKLSSLTKLADIIVPNFTEASLILEEDYNPTPTKDQIEKMLKTLNGKTSASIVLTGVDDGSLGLGACVLNNQTGKISCSFAEKLPASFHGTGDVFASALVGEIIKGKTLESACQTACTFTTASAKFTMLSGQDLKYGVAFEKYLKMLTE